MRYLHGTRHVHGHQEKEMLKNVKIIKIGQRLGVAHDRQSFST